MQVIQDYQGRVLLGASIPLRLTSVPFVEATVAWYGLRAGIQTDYLILEGDSAVMTYWINGETSS